MRKPSACAACRSRRRKCQTTEEGGPSCVYCNERGIACDFSPPEGGYYEQRAQQRSSGQAITPQSPPTPPHAESHAAKHPRVEPSRNAGSSVPLPGLALRLDLVRLYFDYVHDQFHSLFHRPSFIEDVLHDRVPHGILFGMIALSARFSTDPFFASINPRDRGLSYLVESEALLNVRDVSLATVQHCVLLGGGWIANGNAHAENLYYGIACRLAQLLNMPEGPASNLLESEINLRAWWSLSMIDVWSSAAVKLPKLLPTRTDLPLPMDDLSFLSLTSDAHTGTNVPAFSHASPLLAQMVKLNRILQDVNTFNQQCVTENPDWTSLVYGVEALTTRMDDWLTYLPENLRDTPDNFAWFASRGLGRIFAAVYLGYYHFGQLLYYQFLHGAGTDAPPPPTSPSHELFEADRRREYAYRCKDHAGRLCEMVYRAHTTADSDVRYTMTAHVLVIASTVQIHALLFSADEDDITVARNRLERNFELLLRLQVYWPSVDHAISRLRAFHAMARKGVGASYVLDRWMLRFLVEFAETMEEKEMDAWRSSSEEMEALWHRSPASAHR